MILKNPNVLTHIGTLCTWNCILKLKASLTTKLTRQHTELYLKVVNQSYIMRERDSDWWLVGETFEGMCVGVCVCVCLCKWWYLHLARTGRPSLPGHLPENAPLWTGMWHQICSFSHGRPQTKATSGHEQRRFQPVLQDDMLTQTGAKKQPNVNLTSQRWT